MLHRVLATIFALTLSAGLASGHEFWIEPETFQLAPGDTITGDLRVGQGFKGSSQVYNPVSFRRFEIAVGDDLYPVEGRMGDRPALAAPAREGLDIVIHVTGDYTLRWAEFEKFESFVEHKDAAWTLEAHAARGLPTEGFSEVYSRYAKALIAVGDGQGQDREVGLATEITALANPYTDDLSDGLPVRVTYDGKPRASAQVEVFEKEKDGDEARIFTVKADADGVAVVPVRPGYRYMLDSVVLRETDRKGSVWESLWANLTFAVPGN